MKKPCEGCIVLSNCSHVCNNFLQWCLDRKKTNLKSHPHYNTSFISIDQMNWVNEKIKEYAPD